jgi:hypothetical protein
MVYHAKPGTVLLTRKQIKQSGKGQKGEVARKPCKITKTSTPARN